MSASIYSLRSLFISLLVFLFIVSLCVAEEKCQDVCDGDVCHRVCEEIDSSDIEVEEWERNPYFDIESDTSLSWRTHEPASEFFSMHVNLQEKYDRSRELAIQRLGWPSVVRYPMSGLSALSPEVIIWIRSSVLSHYLDSMPLEDDTDTVPRVEAVDPITGEVQESFKLVEGFNGDELNEFLQRNGILEQPLLKHIADYRLALYREKKKWAMELKQTSIFLNEVASSNYAQDFDIDEYLTHLNTLGRFISDKYKFRQFEMVQRNLFDQRNAVELASYYLSLQDQYLDLPSFILPPKDMLEMLPRLHGNFPGQTYRSMEPYPIIQLYQSTLY